jgi:hypothetical protein
MKWDKKGLIFVPGDYHNHFPWLKSHAAPPVCDLIGNGIARIYFSCRDKKGRSRPLFIEVDAANPKEIRYIHDKPILELGELGTFDDNGIMPSCLVEDGDRKLLYYIGWNPQRTVSYRLAIGLAESTDGKCFKKISEGPICDRSVDEPYFNTAPFVIREDDLWKMWYVSCTGWKIIDDWPEPYYHIKYAESKDGINWKRTGVICINYNEYSEAIGKPYVFKEEDIYKMIYSYRKTKSYRSDKSCSYRLGYAESVDGINWTRKDNAVGIELAAEGWDSLMMEYCTGYVYEGRRYLIYNGNGFGETGFGYAILKDEK